MGTVPMVQKCVNMNLIVLFFFRGAAVPEEGRAMDFLVSSGILGGGIVTVVFRVVTAVVVFVVGQMVVGVLMKALTKLKLLEKIEPTARTFFLSAARMGMTVLLLFTLAAFLGVPMDSIVSLVATAAAAVGLAMQGTLSNLAGGILLFLFKPFRVGDFIGVGSMWGGVAEITLFYTVLKTGDNRRITLPNGPLMNGNITNVSANKTCRVDRTYSCATTEDPERVRQILLDVANANEKVLKAPEAPPPFVGLSRTTAEALEFTVRVWCLGWDFKAVDMEILTAVSEAFAENGIRQPGKRVVSAMGTVPMAKH